ncbi:LysR family transcriptional regulator, partial [Klebsiella pneumoniae]|nr:LysR family transcriptional regulator [Klebsiella pneumoniae]
MSLSAFFISFRTANALFAGPVDPCLSRCHSTIPKITTFRINVLKMGIMMEKRLPGLDLDALRSFVTGMECGSFAQAALRLSRSTSAVSAQLKKLESQCGAALV